MRESRRVREGWGWEASLICPLSHQTSLRIKAAGRGHGQHMSPQASIVPQGTAQQADMDKQSSTGSSAKAAPRAMLMMMMRTETDS